MLHNRYALRHFVTTCVRFYFRNELPSPITLPEDSSQWKDPEFYEVYSGCAYSDPKLDKEFITIPGGSAYSTTGYYATLKTFKLMKREVTTLDYKECVNAGACRPTYSNNEFDSNRTAVGNAFEEDAKDYCKWIGGRVPTYIEWMYAASYGKDENEIRIFPWGNRFPDFCVTARIVFVDGVASTARSSLKYYHIKPRSSVVTPMVTHISDYKIWAVMFSNGYFIVPKIVTPPSRCRRSRHGLYATIWQRSRKFDELR